MIQFTPHGSGMFGFVSPHIRKDSYPVGTQHTGAERPSVDELLVPFRMKDAAPAAVRAAYPPVTAPRAIRGLLLEAGDILVMGTPSGVGNAREPKLFMKQGDVCEVEIEGVGLIRNPIVNEA